MAAPAWNFYRNYDNSDNVYVQYTEPVAIPFVDDLEWDAPTDKAFSEWNTARDG